MDRLKLQQLAELRLKDAEALLAAERWDAAYYLLGYAVECALKACVTKRFREHEVPDRKLVQAFYTHRLEDLLTISGLSEDLGRLSASDADFAGSWVEVRKWSELSRYSIVVGEEKARDFHKAVTHHKFGVLTWLKAHW